jgi:hypothetical protein
MKNVIYTTLIVMIFVLSSYGEKINAKKINYYRVQIEAQAKVIPINTKSAIPDNRSGLVACKVKTELHLDFWFTEKGEYKYQKCSIQLKNIECPGYGSADTCKWTPKPEALKPMSFKTKAELKKNSATLGKLVHDQIQIKFPKNQQSKKLVFTVLCPEGTPGDVSDYGTIFNQIFMVLNKEVALFPVFLGTTEKTFSDHVLFGLYKVHIDYSIHQSIQGVAVIED